MNVLSPALAVLLLSAAAHADVLKVPKDFATIQEAVDAALAGDEVVISAGTYTEAFIVLGKTDLVVRGKGKVVLTGGNVSDVAITVDGSNAIRIQHLRIDTWAGPGVLVDGSVDTTLLHLVLRDVVGMGLHASESTGTILDHCTLSGNGADAIVLGSCTGSVVRKCVVKDVDFSGLIVQSGSDLAVEKCRFDGTGNLGVSLDSGGDPASFTMSHCLVRKTVGIGLVANTSGLHAEKNRLLKCGSEGIVDDGQGSEYVSNRIVGAGGRGVYLAGEGSFLLQGNRILHSLGEGVIVNDDVTGGTMTGNKILHPGNNGIEIFGPAQTADHNLVKGAANDGFDIESSGSTYSHNTAKGSGGFDLFQAVGQTNTYVDNHFKTSSLP